MGPRGSRPQARLKGGGVQVRQEVLDELVRRIFAEVGPRRVVLFGSAARGEMRPDSDIDLLIVMPDGTHRRRTAQYLYGRLGSDRPPVDLVVATESDILDHGDVPGYVYRDALREGRELYAA
jgi:predicted nucleotidyltransferase